MREILIACLLDFIHEKKGAYVKDILANRPELTLDEWMELAYMCQIHNLGGMVYLVLRDGKLAPPEILKQFKQQFDFVAMISMKQELGMGLVEAALYKAGVPHIYFKGWEVKHDYPVKEVRLMSDVDFLIRMEDRKKADAALCQVGFERTSESPDVWVYKKDILHLEMHTSLEAVFEKEEIQSDFFADAFTYGLFEKDSMTGSFQKEYHMTFLIYHLAKHMNSTGAGIRMYMDIALFWMKHQEEMDVNRLQQMLEQLGMWEFAQHVFGICKRWFQVSIPGEKPLEEDWYQIVLDYVMEGGVYGHTTRGVDSLYARKSVNSDNIGNQKLQRIQGLMQYFFPSRKAMEKSMPFVRRYPFLLPVAWGIRGIKGLVLRREFSMNNIQAIYSGREESEKEYRLLKKLGL